MGSCADTTAQVAVELYPTAVTATANAHHPSPTSLLDRYQDGNVLVDVYSNAPGKRAHTIGDGQRAGTGPGLRRVADF